MTVTTPRTSVRLLGIDGGGTTTEAWLAEPGCHVLGRGTAGPSNAKAVGPEAARQALDTAIRGAFHAAGLTSSPVDVICLGLAGFDRPDDRKILAGWADEAGWARRIVMVNDGDLVIAAGTPEGWGVGVIAGTGSIAVGRAKDGRTARAGGWGHLIGDEGSAYGIVLDALRLVARRADGRAPRPPGRDPLTERVCTALGVAEASQIVTTIYSAGVFAHTDRFTCSRGSGGVCRSSRDRRAVADPRRCCARRDGRRCGSIAWLDVGSAPPGGGRRVPPLRRDRATRNDRRTDPARIPASRDSRR